MWRTSFQIWKSERSVLLVNAVTIWPLAPNAAEAEYPDLDLNQGLDLRRVGHRRGTMRSMVRGGRLSAKD